jgi:hypothetical protein
MVSPRDRDTEGERQRNRAREGDRDRKSLKESSKAYKKICKRFGTGL